MYIDPGNLEFTEEPSNCSLTMVQEQDHTVQYTYKQDHDYTLLSSQGIFTNSVICS